MAQAQKLQGSKGSHAVMSKTQSPRLTLPPKGDGKEIHVAANVRAANNAAKANF
jgi:hypothetical protein